MLKDFILDTARTIARAKNYERVKYFGKWNSYDVYEPRFLNNYPDEAYVPQFILYSNGKIRWTESEVEYKTIVADLKAKNDFLKHCRYYDGTQASLLNNRYSERKFARAFTRCEYLTYLDYIKNHSVWCEIELLPYLQELSNRNSIRFDIIKSISNHFGLTAHGNALSFEKNKLRFENIILKEYLSLH